MLRVFLETGSFFHSGSKLEVFVSKISELAHILQQNNHRIIGCLHNTSATREHKRSSLTSLSGSHSVPQIQTVTSIMLISTDLMYRIYRILLHD